MTMVSRSVRWAYVCTKMDMGLPSTGQNTGVQKPIGSTAASVNIPVHRRNTAGPYISLPTTIQDRIFQGIVPAMSNVYVHFSQISFPARYSVVNFQLGSHSLRFREVIIVRFYGYGLLYNFNLF